MEKKVDDIDAVRTLVETLKGFDTKDQQRIIRWTAEKLNLPSPFGQPASRPSEPSAHGLPQSPSHALRPSDAATPGSGKDIRSFVEMKRPRSDVQFAATVAYYYQFEAPEAERKAAINKEDLQDACRKAGRKRPPNPFATLNNARNLGLLDKGDAKGSFSINSVGENLVAMTLPGDGTNGNKPSKKKAKGNSKKKLGTGQAKKAASKAKKA